MQTESAYTRHAVSPCTTLNLRRASRAASQFLERYLSPLGLHASQFGVLRHLTNEGQITISRLADVMSLDRTTLTRNLQIMTRDGLVAVTTGSDKRVRDIKLTDKGCDVYKQAIPLWEQAEADLTDKLGSNRREALLAYIDALIALESR